MNWWDLTEEGRRGVEVVLERVGRWEDERGEEVEEVEQEESSSGEEIEWSREKRMMRIPSSRVWSGGQ